MLTVGDLLRLNREELNISQETLSYGICSVSNLSRIENGEQVPSRATYEALMQRMGLSPEVFPSFLNDRELTAFQLKHELDICIAKGNYEKAKDIVTKLEKEPKLDNVYKQYILFARTVISRRKGASPESVLESMKQAVAMSIQGFNPKKIIRYVLSKNELSILNNLAVSYANVGDNESAIDVLYGIKEYLEKRAADREGIAAIYVTVLYNLSKYVGLKGRNEEVINLCDIGIKFGLEYGHGLNVAGLLFNKGYALVMLDCKEEAQEYIQNAYYIWRVLKHLNYCKTVKEFADEHGITI